MENIRKNYILVGVLEDYATTLKLLEVLLPGFFGGASRLYSQNKDLLIYSGRTKIKMAPSTETIGLVRTWIYKLQYFSRFENLKNHEIEALKKTKRIRYEQKLYNFVLDLFYEKVEQYGLLD